MLTQEENDLLTRTGPGTPGGALLRSYWQPVALAAELPIGGPPLPVRIMSEDLVLFRDDSGEFGLLGIHCSHRGADLSYGRLEDGGLRCIYHGWLYDRHGRCLEQPGEPSGSTFHERIRQQAYPCREVGGLILTYMGPGDPPPVPQYEFLVAPEEYRIANKDLKACNYLQGNEGNIDPQHLGILHWTASAPPDSTVALHARNPKMVIETEETDFGVRLYHLVPLDADTNYVKITNFVLPNLATFEGAVIGDVDGFGVNWHVPIDDTHHWGFTLWFDRRTPLAKARVLQARASATNFQRVRTKANRYLQDRDEMKSQNFSGLGTAFGDQDACVIEPMPIQDRTREQLGSNDRAIIAARHMLLREIQRIQAHGGRPSPDRNGMLASTANIIVTAEVIPSSVDWRAYLTEKAANAVGASATGSPQT